MEELKTNLTESDIRFAVLECVVTGDHYNSVKFVPNEIDTTNTTPGATAAEYYAPGRQNATAQTPNWNSPSPFGVWGALGTRGSGDDVGVMPGA